jgi:hypothetical protein
MDVGKEYENWNMKCEKLIVVRRTKVLHNKLSKLDFDVVALQETQSRSGIQNLITLHYLIADQKARNMNLTVVDFM